MNKYKHVPEDLPSNQVSLSVISKTGGLNVVREHLSLRAYWTDPFHTLVDMSWFRLLSLLTLIYVTCWLGFACLYSLCEDCIAGNDSRLGHQFAKNFFFSVQTMTTIGFGEMHPKSAYANIIVCIQSLVGIFLSSTLFGIIFVKFSRPQTRCASILFSNVAVICKRDGKTCLMFRILNVKKHMLVHPKLSLYFVSNHTTREGEKLIKFEMLEIANCHTPFFGLPWTVVHCIDEKSPLYKRSIDNLKETDAEIIVILEASDASSNGTFQSRYYYTSDDFRAGARFVDIVTRGDDGQYHVDHAKFHDWYLVNQSPYQQASLRLSTTNVRISSDAFLEPIHE